MRLDLEVEEHPNQLHLWIFAKTSLEMVGFLLQPSADVNSFLGWEGGFSTGINRFLEEETN